jgi:hypothetical protein
MLEVQGVEFSNSRDSVMVAIPESETNEQLPNKRSDLLCFPLRGRENGSTGRYIRRRDIRQPKARSELTNRVQASYGNAAVFRWTLRCDSGTNVELSAFCHHSTIDGYRDVWDSFIFPSQHCCQIDQLVKETDSLARL